MAHKQKKSRRTPKKVNSVQHPELTFSAKDFPHHPKNQLWYIGIGLLAVAILALLYQSREYLLMLVVLAALLATIRLGNLEPRSHQVRLDHRGVSWGEDFHPYFHLRAFWIAEASNGTTSIYLERLNFSPTLHFIIPENRLEEAVLFLSEHLPWHHHRNEPLADRFSRLLRL